jgi:hypothetical protein
MKLVSINKSLKGCKTPIKKASSKILAPNAPIKVKRRVYKIVRNGTGTLVYIFDLNK